MSENILFRLIDSIPNGIGSRILTGQIAIGQGIGYLYLYLSDTRRTTSYTFMESIAPLWAWGLVLVVAGILYWMTATHRRRDMAGRAVAIVMMGVNVWLASTFAVAGAITAIGTYVPIIIFIFGEIVSVDTGRTKHG